MNKPLALACAAAGLLGFGAVRAEAAQPVNTLPAVAHINQTVVVVRHRHHHHHRYYHHRRYYYRHHRRFYY